MTTFVHAGCNANYFLDAAVNLEESQTPDFATVLSLYGVHHIMSETSDLELTDLSIDLPSDTHLVTFRTPEGAVSSDAVRAFTRTDIFDAFHDSGLTVLAIRQGYGSIRPNIYNTQPKETQK